MNSNDSNKGDLSRRAAIAVGLAPLIVPRHVLGGVGFQAPSDKLRIAAVGVAGMGRNYIHECADEAIVALCDLDHTFAAPVFRSYPSAKLYKDFRQMFDKESKNFDALIVATPDHWHSHLVLAGLAMDKHVYCAKPITHTVAEARQVKAACLASKRTTKASIQDSRTSYARATTELLLSGAIGPVHEVHIWTGTYSSGGGFSRPESETAPEGMNWDAWCGPSPARPYAKTYHYGNWRPWWDFGTGTIGDFGCHNLQMFHDELEMGTPDWVAGIGCQAFVAGPKSVDNAECMSVANTVQWHIPARGSHPPLMAYFYDGGLAPPRPESMPANVNMPGSGVMFVGEKGVQISAYYGGNPWAAFVANPTKEQMPRGLPGGYLLPEAKFKDFKQPAPTLPRCEKPDHYKEWVRMCKAGKKSITPIEFACGLTEFALLGTLALRRHAMPTPAPAGATAGRGGGGGRGGRQNRILTWDHNAMKITNDEVANSLVDTPYRKEWDYKA